MAVGERSGPKSVNQLLADVVDISSPEGDHNIGWLKFSQEDSAALIQRRDWPSVTMAKVVNSIRQFLVVDSLDGRLASGINGWN